MARRFNLLLAGMLCVSALLHAGVLFMTRTEAVSEPRTERPSPVHILGQVAEPAAALTAPPRELPLRAEPSLPDVKLPLAEGISTHAEPPPKRIARPPVQRIARSPVLHRQPKPHSRSPEKVAGQADSPKQQAGSPPVTATGELTGAGTGISGSLRPGGAGESGSPHAGGTGGADLNAYLSEVVRKIERHKEYPLRARTSRLEGRTTIRFHLLANGHIRPPEVAQPSGHAILDQAALAAVNRASPFSPPPEELSGGAIPLEVVLVFQLR